MDPEAKFNGNIVLSSNQDCTGIFNKPKKLVVTACQRSGEGYIFIHVCVPVCLFTGRGSEPYWVPLYKAPAPCCPPYIALTPSPAPFPWEDPAPDIFKLVHYVARTVRKADGWHSTERPSCYLVSSSFIGIGLKLLENEFISIVREKSEWMVTY